MQNYRRIQSERLRVRSDPGDAFDSVFQQVVVGKQFLGLHPIFPVAPGSHVFTSAFPALRDRRSGPPLREVHEPSPGRKRGGRKGQSNGMKEIPMQPPLLVPLLLPPLLPPPPLPPPPERAPPRPPCPPPRPVLRRALWQSS